MNNLNIFIVSTGCYNQYLEWLYPSLENLFPKFSKHVYLISDENIEYNLNLNIKYNYFHITDLPYPFITYNKVVYICDCINIYNINKNEYFIFLDADSIILKKSESYWDNLIQVIDQNKICFSRSPWRCGYYENNLNTQSITHINNMDHIYDYIQSSMFFGYIYKLFDINLLINEYIDYDYRTNRIIPFICDQSIINKILIDDNFKCNIDDYLINYYNDIKNINNINWLDPYPEWLKNNEDKKYLIRYEDYKKSIFCVQKFNSYIKHNKRNIFLKNN